jgi:hypothetical protein
MKNMGVITGSNKAVNVSISNFGVSTNLQVLSERNNIETLFNCAYLTAYHELTYDVDGNVTNVDVWDTALKGTKLFSKVISYSGGNIDEVTITDELTSKVLTKSITYDVDGNIETVTKVIA